MARPLPVNLLLSGVGSVLLVSGIGGVSLSQVIQGDFGNLKTNPKAGSEGANKTSTAQDEEGLTQNVGDAVSPTVFSEATFAPSPTSFSKSQPTPKQQAKAIAEILYNEGITKATPRQIELARRKYEEDTGVKEFEE